MHKFKSIPFSYYSRLSVIHPNWRETNESLIQYKCDIAENMQNVISNITDARN